MIAAHRFSPLGGEQSSHSKSLSTPGSALSTAKIGTEFELPEHTQILPEDSSAGDTAIAASRIGALSKPIARSPAQGQVPASVSKKLSLSSIGGIRALQAASLDAAGGRRSVRSTGADAALVLGTRLDVLEVADEAV